MSLPKKPKFTDKLNRGKINVVNLDVCVVNSVKWVVELTYD